MLIHVVYSDNQYDYVKDVMLDLLIQGERVKKFKRRSGWVTVGVDPVRGKGTRSSYNGAERRGGEPAPLMATGSR